MRGVQILSVALVVFLGNGLAIPLGTTELWRPETSIAGRGCIGKWKRDENEPKSVWERDEDEPGSKWKRDEDEPGSRWKRDAPRV